MRLKGLLMFILIVASGAYVAGRFRPDAWYSDLAKPSWTPPGWLFPPVWALLYLAIAIAGWLVWGHMRERVSTSFFFWILQLLLNVLWTWLFFGQHRIGAACIDILLLLSCVITFIILTIPRHRTAAFLFVPYAVWVAYASSLNVAIWMLNRR
jgi:translocator protein